jgi:hypothetical protein
MGFFWRLGALVVLFALIAWIDWRRKAAQATKWREYSFLLVAGLLGGLIGVAIDQVTATISPDYFVLGKGIPTGDGFRLGVAGLGFQAGLVMGMVVGGIYLIANNPRPDRRSLRSMQLLRFALPPVLASMLLVPLAAFTVHCWDPLNLARELSDLLSPTQTDHFLTVWGMHLGIYAGGILGTSLRRYGNSTATGRDRRSASHSLKESAMKPRWQFKLSSLLGAIVALSVLTILIAKFGASGVILFLLISALLVGIVGLALRRPILALCGFCSLPLVVLVSFPFLIVAVGDGHKKVPLKFVVVDAGSNQPIAGATVHLRKIDSLPSLSIPPGEKGVAKQSAQDGSVVLVWEFPTSSRDGLLEHSGGIYFSAEHLWVQTSAPGFTTQLVQLESLTGRSRDISNPFPPPMKILIAPNTQTNP